MAKKNDNIRKLIRELELGKKKMRLDYNRGIRAIDEAIATLVKLNLDATSMIKSVHHGTVGRPSREKVNVVQLVERSNGRRGRLPNTGGKNGVSLTSMLFDTVSNKKRFIHQRDIVAAVYRKYPEEGLSEFSKKISVSPASLKRQGKLITVNQGGYRRNIYWGMPNWVNESGQILDAFSVKAEKVKKEKKLI